MVTVVVDLRVTADLYEWYADKFVEFLSAQEGIVSVEKLETKVVWAKEGVE